MINLLPSEDKRQLRAAHANSILVWYIILVLAGSAFLSGILYVSYNTLHTTKTVNEALTIKNQSQATSDYGTTQAQAAELSSSLASAQSFLSSETNYSKLLVGIAGDMPAGTVLSELKVSSSTINSPLSLQFLATTNAAGQALVSTLQADSGLFSNVTMTSMTSSGSGSYPITVQLSVTLNRTALE